MNSLCLCGCGQRCSRPESRYLKGHNRRGVTRPLSERLAISRARTGMKFSAEHVAHLTSVHSKLSFRLKISRSKGGDGRFLVDHPYCTRSKLRRLRLIVDERDGHRCVRCGRKLTPRFRGNRISTVNTHHVVPVSVGRKSRLCDDPSNMVSLCYGCHHLIESRWQTPETGWKSFLPIARKHLLQFDYPKLLLDSYALRPR